MHTMHIYIFSKCKSWFSKVVLHNFRSFCFFVCSNAVIIGTWKITWTLQKMKSIMLLFFKKICSSAVYQSSFEGKCANFKDNRKWDQKLAFTQSCRNHYTINDIVKAGSNQQLQQKPSVTRLVCAKCISKVPSAFVHIKHAATASMH